MRRRRVSIYLNRHAALHSGTTYAPVDVRFDDSLPLVFTHGDISMNNVRLGRDGKVWLMDWGASGFYPQWFEYANMRAYEDREQHMPWLWRWCIPVVAGWYRAQYQFMLHTAGGLFHCSLELPDDYEI